jgi:hypothetical protein
MTISEARGRPIPWSVERSRVGQRIDAGDRAGDRDVVSTTGVRD